MTRRENRLVPVAREDAPELSDEDIVLRVNAGETELFARLLRRYNQRVYRAARAVLRDDGEAEDVAQEAWVRGFRHLRDFQGRALFSTWITRIAVHEAMARSRRARRTASSPREIDPVTASPTPDPESEAFDREMRTHIEAAVEALPAAYRTVFVLREVEELSTRETAESLELSEDAVKTRLHRARAMLRQDLLARAGSRISGIFPFMGARCDRMVEAVMIRVGSPVR
ncbi:MAG: RNA polymerase sigma factor [Acidobacteriota bacterium]